MKDFETNGCSKYGAQMGRHSRGYFNLYEKVRLYHVPLDSGGYDKGGAYWGIGQSLYCAEAEDAVYYFRASNRESAKEYVWNKFGTDLKFYK